MKFITTSVRVLSYTAIQVEVVIPDWNSYTAVSISLKTIHKDIPGYVPQIGDKLQADINIKALTVFDLAPHNFSQ